MEAKVPAKVKGFLSEVEGEAVACLSCTISNQGEWERATELLKKIKGHAKAVEEHRFSITKPMDEAKAAVMAFFRPALERCKAAEMAIKQAIIKYDEEQKEQQRLAQEAENRRAREEEERRRNLIAEKAEKALEKGHVEQAEMYLAHAEDVKVTPMNVAAAKRTGSGIALPESWEFEVINPDLVPREFLMVDEQKLRRYAKAMKESAKVEGVRFYSRKLVSARSA